VIQNAGFGMAFQTMPYLFEQWGSTFVVVFAGLVIIVFCWYYFISYGTPWMGFMRDEFGWSKNKGAWSLEQ
jgi:hypothetical protein